MNRETIIQMAREAGLAEVTDTAESLPADYVEALAKLCALSVAKEREECSEDDEGAIALYERPQEVGLTDDQADAVSMALRRAWQLGQTYWQQADSDYISQHKKSEETQRKFQKLCDDTIAALRAKGGK